MKPLMTRDSIVAALADHPSCPLDGETVLLNLTTGVYGGLDGVGTRVWELIQRPTRVADVRDALLRQYEVDPERCESDLLAFLSELADARFVAVEGVGEARNT